MSIKKDQYYISIWQQVLNSLTTSGNVSSEVIKTFFPQVILIALPKLVIVVR